MPIDHLLIVNKTYLMILRVKKQREVHELIVEFIDINVTMMAKVQYGKKEGNAKENFKKQNTRKENRFYVHYKTSDNVNETCFKLYGYPY